MPWIKVLEFQQESGDFVEMWRNFGNKLLETCYIVSTVKQANCLRFERVIVSALSFNLQIWKSQNIFPERFYE